MIKFVCSMLIVVFVSGCHNRKNIVVTNEKGNDELAKVTHYVDLVGERDRLETSLVVLPIYLENIKKEGPSGRARLLSWTIADNGGQLRKVVKEIAEIEFELDLKKCSDKMCGLMALTNYQNNISVWAKDRDIYPDFDENEYRDEMKKLMDEYNKAKGIIKKNVK